MATIITQNLLNSDDKQIESFIFDYLEDNQNCIHDRNILVVLKYLGYVWEWDESTQTISNINKGEWLDNSIINIEDSFDETMDIETEITHSYNANGMISHNTVNLPKTATVDDISDAYKDVYKRGIIGVSVYRDGSRGEGVLTTSLTTDDTKIVKNNAPKRPKVLDAKMHQFVVNKQSYFVAIGLLNNDLYEVFTGINHKDDGELFIPKCVTIGTIIKNGKGDYDFIDSETKIIYHLSDSHSNAEAAALTRSISTSLRHGVDISILVHQLEKTKGALNSFAKAITRTLKHYIADGTKVHGEKCPECGADIIRVEGCKRCSQCAFSKCG